MSACLGAAAIQVALHKQASHGYASAATPPVVPTYRPTPIGYPPLPPTNTPTATPTATLTPVANGSPTATASGTPAASATAITGLLSFSLDAARVSKENTPGNLSGLAAVARSSHVWLMMYFTVKSVPKAVKRITTYTIRFDHRTIYQAVYQSAQKPSDLGRYSRYVAYTFPSSLPYGSYLFRAKLSIGGVAKSKTWPFRVARQERVAKNAAGA